LVAGGVGSLDNLLQAVEIMEQSRIQLDFQIARSASRAVIRLADLAIGSDVEFEHIEGVSLQGNGGGSDGEVRDGTRRLKQIQIQIRRH